MKWTEEMWGGGGGLFLGRRGLASERILGVPHSFAKVRGVHISDFRETLGTPMNFSLASDTQVG